jgi:hypothetical protein
MQSTAGMTKEEKVVYHCQERYAAVCDKRRIETYHTKKNYEANIHFIHIEQKTHVTSN